jgi:LysM repeat protein
VNLPRRAFLTRSGLALLGLACLRFPAFAAETRRTYRVKKGDTLSSIAVAHGTSVAALRSLNKLKDDRINAGQTLLLPAPDIAKDEAPPAEVPRDAAPASVLAPVIAASRGLRIEPGRWRQIVVHHSGIEAGNAKSYDGAHRRRGMENGLAYHFVIGNGRDSGDGLIEIGPRWTKQLLGGHVRSVAVNEYSLGICLVGNFEKRSPGARQLASMHALIDWLRGPGLPGDARPNVTVHRWVDRNHTVCPGRRFPFAALKKRYPTG